jgi:hypothetical protein
VGQTNGRFVIHITDKSPPDKSRASTTIYSAGDWLGHPLNKLNTPSKRKQETEGIDGFIEKFTKHTAALNTAMGHLSSKAVKAAAAMTDLQEKGTPDAG